MNRAQDLALEKGIERAILLTFYQESFPNIQSHKMTQSLVRAGLEIICSKTAFRTLIFGCLALIIIRAIYNIYLHPLRCFKGPIWATISPFYLTYLFATKKSHLKTKKLHEKYGTDLTIYFHSTGKADWHWEQDP